MKSYRLVHLMFLLLLIPFCLKAQTQNLQHYSGEKDGGKIEYSYYEDSKGNIVLHGQFEHHFKQKIKMGYDEMVFPAYFKGKFENGKKIGKWVYQIPMYYSNKSSAFGGGTDRIHVTLDRNKLTEKNYQAEGYIPGDNYIVEQGNRTITANFKDGHLNGDLTIEEKYNTKIYEKMAREADKLKNDKGQTNLRYYFTFKDNTLNGDCGINEDGEVLMTGSFSNGYFDKNWSLTYDTVDTYGRTGIDEELGFADGILLSGRKMYEKPKYSNIDNTNDIMQKIADLQSHGKSSEYGFSVELSSLIKLQMLPNQFSDYNEVPVQNFGGLSRHIKKLLYLVDEATSFKIEFYDLSHEAIIGFRVRNLQVTDKNKFSSLLGSQFDNIYKKYIEAIGGLENVQKIKSYEVIERKYTPADPNWHGSKDSYSKYSTTIKWKYPDYYYFFEPDSVFETFQNPNGPWREDFIEEKNTYFWSSENGSFKIKDGEPILVCDDKEKNHSIYQSMFIPLYQLKLLKYSFIIDNNHYDKKEIKIVCISPDKDSVSVILDKGTYLITSFAGRNFHKYLQIKANYKEINKVLLPIIFETNLQNNESFGAKYSYEINKPISINTFSPPDEKIREAKTNTQDILNKQEEKRKQVENDPINIKINKIIQMVRTIDQTISNAESAGVKFYAYSNKDWINLCNNGFGREFISYNHKLHFLYNNKLKLILIFIQWDNGEYQFSEKYYFQDEKIINILHTSKTSADYNFFFDNKNLIRGMKNWQNNTEQTTDLNMVYGVKALDYLFNEAKSKVKR
jgi:hypothetical protein